MSESDGFDATFHTFRASGKWYATGRGYLPANVYEVFRPDQRRATIIAANSGKCPGLSGPGAEFAIVVVPDDHCEYGFPLMLKTISK